MGLLLCQKNIGSDQKAQYVDVIISKSVRFLMNVARDIIHSKKNFAKGT